MNSFSEKQRFTQWWLWAIIIASAIVPLVIEIVNSRPVMPRVSELLYSMIPFAIIIPFMLMLKLYTTIDETGITYRFAPFHIKLRKKGWSEIEYAYIRKYNPILEYGGWGIRMGLGGRGMALNISGNMGLQLVLKNGKKMLIGTQQPEQVMAVLTQLVKERKISGKMLSPQP